MSEAASTDEELSNFSQMQSTIVFCPEHFSNRFVRPADAVTHDHAA
jgi:hypothetical protein